jgi:hypothetical protein
MCTVSVIPLRFACSSPPPGVPSFRAGEHAPQHGFRLVTNRDEVRTRPPATAPRWRGLGDGRARAVFPTDGGGGRAEAAAGGTWVAASESGLVLCLLNGNPRPYPALPGPDRLVSRGVIVPQLIGCRDAEQAAGAAARLDLDAFAPFLLLAVDLAPSGRAGAERGPRVFRVRWDRERLVTSRDDVACVCAVSSGLGDDLVRPRLGLFSELMATVGARPETQDCFHRHVWRDRPEISVMMSRRDARTVSVTTVEVVAAGEASPGRVSMHYQPIRASGEYGDPVVHRTAIAGWSRMRGGVRVPVVAG